MSLQDHAWPEPSAWAGCQGNTTGSDNDSHVRSQSCSTHGFTCPISITNPGQEYPTCCLLVSSCSRGVLGWGGASLWFPEYTQTGQHIVKHSPNKLKQKGSFLEKDWKIIKQRQSPVFILLLWLTQQKANRLREKLNPNGKGVESDGKSFSSLQFPEGRWEEARERPYTPLTLCW